MTKAATDKDTTKESTKKAKKPRATKRKASNKQSTRAPSSPKGGQASNAISAQLRAKAQLQVLQESREARFHDGAWLVPSSYDVSHVPPAPSAHATGGSTDGSHFNVASAYGGSFSSFLEQEETIIARALQANGLSYQDISKEGIGCLIEQGRKYALELLADATDYAGCDGTMGELSAADLMLASELREDGNQKELDVTLAQVANETNRRLLPPIPSNCYNGVVLHKSDPNTLMDRTFDVIPTPLESVTSESKQKEDEEKPMEIDDIPGDRKKKAPSYGAKVSKGKQIEISIKSTLRNE